MPIERHYLFMWNVIFYFDIYYAFCQLCMCSILSSYVRDNNTHHILFSLEQCSEGTRHFYFILFKNIVIVNIVQGVYKNLYSFRGVF
jgi:hypothetical protein